MSVIYWMSVLIGKVTKATDASREIRTAISTQATKGLTHATKLWRVAGPVARKIID